MVLGYNVMAPILALFFPHVTSILVFLVCFLAVRHILSRILLHPNLPPGPRPLPVVGNLLQFGSDPHKALAKMANQYGAIMTIYLGPMCAVVLSDLEVVKEAMVVQGDVFSDREQPSFLEEAFQLKGIVLLILCYISAIGEPGDNSTGGI